MSNLNKFSLNERVKIVQPYGYSSSYTIVDIYVNSGVHNEWFYMLSGDTDWYPEYKLIKDDTDDYEKAYHRAMGIL